MKKIAFIVLAILLNVAGNAADKYHIHFKWPGGRDSMIYMAHYYGKSWPDFVVMDSAKLDMDGTAEFIGKDTGFAGGVCIMLLDRTTHFDFLLDKSDGFDITVFTDRLPEGLKVAKISFIHSPENDHFQEYFNLLKDYSETKKKINGQLPVSGDLASLRAEAAAFPGKISAYRHGYEKTHPGTFLADIFNTMETPLVPEAPITCQVAKLLTPALCTGTKKHIIGIVLISMMIDWSLRPSMMGV